MILLDTHVWIRWQNGANDLPLGIQSLLNSADELAISAISCWELSQLIQRRRVTLSMPTQVWIEAALAPDIRCLPIDDGIALLAAELPEYHRDPADRLIIATAIRWRTQLVNLDSAFLSYLPEGLRLLGSGQGGGG